MTKIVLLTISAILILGMVACSNQDEKKTINTSTSPISTASTSKEGEVKDVREAIWNQLSSKEKERIVGTWEDATVSTVTLTKQMAKHSSTDESYIGKEVYIIDFKIKKVQYPDTTAFYADKKTFKLLAMAISE